MFIAMFVCVNIHSERLFAGDPRRPYPTDFEMRHGFLGKLSDLPNSNPMLQSQGSYGEPLSSNRAQSIGMWLG